MTLLTHIKNITKLARMEQQIKNGTVNKWITETTQGIVPCIIDPTSSHVAYAAEDQSSITIRLNYEDLKGLLASPYTFKQSVQAVVAHEMGHIVDTHMVSRQHHIHHAIENNDVETLASLILERENTAWALGKQFSTDLPYYNAFNKLNIRMYQAQIDQARGQ